MIRKEADSVLGAEKNFVERLELGELKNILNKEKR